MASPLSLLIALRFSRGRRRGGMVSLISVISTIGIALGVAVLIVGLSAMNGFERELNNRILAVVPHGEIEPVNQPWNNWNEALAKVEKVKGIVAAAPQGSAVVQPISVQRITPHAADSSSRSRALKRRKTFLLSAKITTSATTPSDHK